jgi:HSP20 family protein
MTNDKSAPAPAKSFPPQVPASASRVFAPLQREFDRILDDLGSGWTSLTEIAPVPRMDLRDTETAVELSVELPGLKRGDVDIRVDDDVLTISGEKRNEVREEDRRYRVFERTYGAFSRSVTLPRSVDPGKIKAVMSDGVLKITAPKRQGEGGKKIEIQSEH